MSEVYKCIVEVRLEFDPSWNRCCQEQACIWMCEVIIIVPALNAVQTSEDIHLFKATDLFRMVNDGHTHQAI